MGIRTFARVVQQGIGSEHLKNNDKRHSATSPADFRQTLSLSFRVQRMPSSSLWRNVERLQLKVNMRVQMFQDPSPETFSKELLDIGDGKVRPLAETRRIKIPSDFSTIVNSQHALSHRPDIYRHTQKYTNRECWSERAISYAQNVDAKK